MINDKNIAEKISSIVAAWKAIFGQQRLAGRILFYFFFLLVFCALCSIPIRFLRSPNPPTITPGKDVLPTQIVGATPTALFNFGSVTFTPFPTLPLPTAVATITPVATDTPTSIQTSSPTVTMTPMSTSTNIVPVTGGSVRIIAVNKSLEYVDIQNFSNETVDLRGWRLVSVTGNQSCPLGGILQPNSSLRIWAASNPDGFSCGYRRNIWNNSAADPAVLYDPQGEEISRYP